MNADADFDRVLDAALDRLAAGEAQAAVLADYAAHAAALAPLLAAAQAARLALGRPVPTPDLARGRQRFLAAAQPLRSPQRSFAAAWRPALALLAVVVVLLVGAGAASANALPGEALYPVKRAVEAVQFALTFDPSAKESLTVDLAARRRAEAARVVDLRREAALAFVGTVEAVTPGRLVISGLTVLSESAAAFAPGDVLAVEARATRTGELVATRLTRLSAAAGPTAPPTVPPRAPTATPTLQPRQSPTPPSPSATATVRASSIAAPATERPATSVPSATRRPDATSTTRPSPASPSATAPATERPADPTATPAERPSDRPPQRP